MMMSPKRCGLPSLLLNMKGATLRFAKLLSFAINGALFAIASCNVQTEPKSTVMAQVYLNVILITNLRNYPDGWVVPLLPVMSPQHWRWQGQLYMMMPVGKLTSLHFFV